MKSSLLIFTHTGYSGPTCLRIEATHSRRKRARFSRLPPYSIAVGAVELHAVEAGFLGPQGGAAGVFCEAGDFVRRQGVGFLFDFA